MAQISDSDEDELNTARSPQHHGYGKPMTPDESGKDLSLLIQTEVSPEHVSDENKADSPGEEGQPNTHEISREEGELNDNEDENMEEKAAELGEEGEIEDLEDGEIIDSDDGIPEVKVYKMNKKFN